jgi:hypothetical protein
MAKRIPGFAPEHVPGDRWAHWKSDQARAAAARFEAETGRLVEVAASATDEATIGLFLIVNGYLKFGPLPASDAPAGSRAPKTPP